MYECPNCAGMLRYDIPLNKMKCDHCDSDFDVNDFSDESLHGKEYETNVFVCPQCGGTMYTQHNDMTGRCSYCGTTQIFQSRTESIVRPHWIAPFRKDKASCKSLYHNAVKKAVFAPKELKDPSFIDSIRGVYMPYWICDCEYDMPINLRVVPNNSIVYHGNNDRKDQYVDISHYTMNTQFEASFLQMKEDASSWYSDEISDNLRPFNLMPNVYYGLMPFNPAYMCGFYGETADVEEPDKKDIQKFAEDSVQTAKSYVYQELKSKYAIENGLNAIKSPNHSKFRLSLLPVWFLSYNKGNRVSYSVINGQTGQLSAEFPIDLKKFFAASLGLFAAIFLILNLFWVMRPEYIAMMAAIGATWSIRFTRRDLKEIARKEYELSPPSRRKYYSKPQRENLSYRYYHILPLVLVVLLVLLENTGYIDRNPHGLMAFLPMILTVWAAIQGSYDIFTSIRNTARVLKGLYAKAFPGYFFAWLSIIIALVVQILHPVSDMYYFGIGFLCMGMTLLSLLSLILSYNRMASRKMPQFEHMGGDGSAKS